jgi:phosphatidylglycerol:prolipoprotein diacylglycerol transferase
LWLLSRNEKVRMRHGVLAGVFLIGYGLSRIIVETVREPDVQLGYLIGGTTMGQWLSVPFLLIGLYLVVRRPKTV